MKKLILSSLLLILPLLVEAQKTPLSKLFADIVTEELNAYKIGEGTSKYGEYVAYKTPENQDNSTVVIKINKIISGYSDINSLNSWELINDKLFRIVKIGEDSFVAIMYSNKQNMIVISFVDVFKVRYNHKRL
ncbi:MAG TPA: hypothetical protein VK982_07080 [Bacteroidales bacterium]|nr:hypothetical protein [Bacteroidales bacterium]